MGRRKQTRGKCRFCGRDFTRSGLIRHLAACPQYQEALLTANQQPGPVQTLYHLVVRDAWYGDYWLHLEMNGAATLTDLDHYLRSIWLECCYHLSRFSIGGWQGQEIPKQRRAEEVFQDGVELTHIYDFGTSSFTLIKPVDQRQGQPLTKHPLALLGRNDPPVYPCMECGQPATWVCMACMIEYDQSGALCDAHADEHSHEGYGEPMPLVNSPRVGMCGYIGPALPPY